jgi:hypothetical protein
VFQYVNKGKVIEWKKERSFLFYRSFPSGERCESCPNSCLTCSNATSCLTCIDQLFLLNGQCVEECPDGYYLYNQQCLSCHRICNSCKGKEIDWFVF